VSFSFSFEDSHFGFLGIYIGDRSAARRGWLAAHTFFAGAKQASGYVGECNSVWYCVILNNSFEWETDIPKVCLAGSTGAPVIGSSRRSMMLGQQPSFLLVSYFTFCVT
jgi:hypothetical protein